IDRRKIEQMYGGPTVAAISCQPLLPGLVGYRAYCPYTLHPRANGSWHAPDLARARRLVAESGTRGQTIVVHGLNDEIGVPSPLAPYFARVLRSLGYRTRVQLAATNSLTAETRSTFQISADGDGLAGYPSASSYFPDAFRCDGSGNYHYHC